MEEIAMNKTESTEVIEKPYTLKKLSAGNIFTFSTILNRIGFKEIKSCFESVDLEALLSDKESNDKMIEKIGLSIMFDIAGIVVSNLDKCKDSIYQLLSDLSGMSKEEIDTLDMNIFINMIFDVFNKEEFKDFFKVVSKLLK